MLRFGIGPYDGLDSEAEVRRPWRGALQLHPNPFQPAGYLEAVASRNKRSKVELPRSVLKSLSSGMSLRISGLR